MGLGAPPVGWCGQIGLGPSRPGGWISRFTSVGLLLADLGRLAQENPLTAQNCSCSSRLNSHQRSMQMDESLAINNSAYLQTFPEVWWSILTITQIHADRRWPLYVTNFFVKPLRQVRPSNALIQMRIEFFFYVKGILVYKGLEFCIKLPIWPTPSFNGLRYFEIQQIWDHFY